MRNKKRMKRVVGVFLGLAIMVAGTSVMPVCAEETPDNETGKIEIGDYLDNCMVDELDDILGFEQVPGEVFGSNGMRYEGTGAEYEWYNYENEDNSWYKPISMRVFDDERLSYHGISFGTEKSQIDKIMKEEGWYPWSSDSTCVDYMKDDGNSYYNFYVQISNGKVTEWSWLNWAQGEYLDIPFEDVWDNYEAWYYDAVKYVHHKWLMTGLNQTTFGPSESLARAQFATILYRMNDEPQMDYKALFSDVNSGMWYTNPILWAANEGVVTGYTNGNFGPADQITREQMAVMMYRYAQSKGYDTEYKADFSYYQDAVYVSGFAQDAMRWAVGNGIITGTSNGTRLNPQGYANRAECATIIMRFCEAYDMVE